MTEEEAKTKWCPFSRHPEGNRVPYGDGTQSSSDHEDWMLFGGEMADKHPCIGSACMAWREDERAPRETMRLYVVETMRDGAPVVRAGTLRVIDGKSWRYEYTDVDEKGEFELLHRALSETVGKHGHCGLAGKP